MSIPSVTCSAATCSSKYTGRIYLTVWSVTDPVRNYIPNLDSLNDFSLVVHRRRYYADYWIVTKWETTEPSKQILPSSAAHHVRQHCKQQQADCRSAPGCLNIHSITRSDCKKLQWRNRNKVFQCLFLTCFLTENWFHATTYSKNPRITGWFRLEGTFKGHLSPWDTFHYTRQLLRTLSKVIFNVSRNRASTTSGDNLFQCFAQPTKLGDGGEWCGFKSRY